MKALAFVFLVWGCGNGGAPASTGAAPAAQPTASPPAPVPASTAALGALENDRAAIETELARVHTAVDANRTALVAARDDAARTSVRAALAKLHADLGEIGTRIQELSSRADTLRRDEAAVQDDRRVAAELGEILDARAADRNELDRSVAALDDMLQDARNDADRAAAKATLDRLKREQAEANAKAKRR